MYDTIRSRLKAVQVFIKVMKYFARLATQYQPSDELTAEIESNLTEGRLKHLHKSLQQNSSQYLINIAFKRYRPPT